MLLNIRDITLLFKDPDRYKDESARNRCHEPPKSLPDEGTTSLLGLAESCVQLLEMRIAVGRFLTFELLITISHLLVILLDP